MRSILDSLTNPNIFQIPSRLRKAQGSFIQFRSRHGFAGGFLILARYNSILSSLAPTLILQFRQRKLNSRLYHFLKWTGFPQRGHGHSPNRMLRGNTTTAHHPKLIEAIPKTECGFNFTIEIITTSSTRMLKINWSLLFLYLDQSYLVISDIRSLLTVSKVLPYGCRLLRHRRHWLNLAQCHLWTTIPAFGYLAKLMRKLQEHTSERGQ